MSEVLETNVDESTKPSEASCHQMVDYLENILNRQVERLRNYDLDGAMDIAEEANDIASAIGKAGLLDQPEYADQRWRIEKLYKNIGLTISAERDEVQDKLKQIRKGIKTLGLYGKNM